MKKIHKIIEDQRGAASLEFTFTLLVVMLVLMSIFDVLKFQTDMGMVFYNEQVATHRVSLVQLDGKSDEMIQRFESQLNEANEQSFFSSLDYSNVHLTCFEALDLQAPVNCDKTSRLISFSYEVRRKYTDNYISQLLNIPVVFKREVFIVNDYFN